MNVPCQTRRGIPYLSQSAVQRFLVDDVLGFDREFAYLARTHFDTSAGRGITWSEALTKLDRTDTPAFIDDWCTAILDSQQVRPETLPPNAGCASLC